MRGPSACNFNAKAGRTGRQGVLTQRRRGAKRAKAGKGFVIPSRRAGDAMSTEETQRSQSLEAVSLLPTNGARERVDGALGECAPKG